MILHRTILLLHPCVQTTQTLLKCSAIFTYNCKQGYILVSHELTVLSSVATLDHCVINLHAVIQCTLGTNATRITDNYCNFQSLTLKCWTKITTSGPAPLNTCYFGAQYCYIGGPPCGSQHPMLMVFGTSIRSMYNLDLESMKWCCVSVILFNNTVFVLVLFSIIVC